MKVSINEITLTNIGDAIRERTGKTDLIAPGDMPAEIRSIVGGSDPVIQELEVKANGTYNVYEGVDGFGPVIVNVPQDGAPPASALVISGNCSYRFAQNGWNWFIDLYGNQITTKDINTTANMFSQSSSLQSIPFDINLNGSYAGATIDCSTMFFWSGIKALPKLTVGENGAIASTSQMFYSCQNLREVPADYFKDCRFTITYYGWYGMYEGCCSLRSLSLEPFDAEHTNYSAYNTIYQNSFYNCMTLDEINNLNCCFKDLNVKSNFFLNTFYGCFRLKRLTFKHDGGAYSWSNQTIDLNSVGYGGSEFQITGYNSGITRDKEITDDASYQALKDDPDRWTTNVAYSRYDHDSAVETINSLPTTSGTGNIIKFKGAAGEKTDAGAINTLTDAEIAVAAAKGWTVTLV